MPLATGCHHVALLTEDLDRFIDFYRTVFDAEVVVRLDEDVGRHALVDLGGGFHLHPFELRDGRGAGPVSEVPFERGHLDHLAVRIDDPSTFEVVRRRLVARGASDGTVTDFGAVASVWFHDPDGMGGELAADREGAPLRYGNRRHEPMGSTPRTRTVTRHQAAEVAIRWLVALERSASMLWPTHRWPWA